MICELSQVCSWRKAPLFPHLLHCLRPCGAGRLHGHLPAVSAALLRGRAEAGGARAPPGQPGGDEPLEVPHGATHGEIMGDHCELLMVFLMDLYGFIWYFVGFIYGFIYGYIYIYTYHIVYIYTLNIVWIYAILADFTSIHDDLWIYDDLWWSVMVFGNIDFTSNIDTYWSHM